MDTAEGDGGVRERFEGRRADDETAEGTVVLDLNAGGGAVVKIAVVTSECQHAGRVSERGARCVHDHVDQRLLVLHDGELTRQAENPAQLGGGAVEALAGRRGNGNRVSRHAMWTADTAGARF